MDFLLTRASDRSSNQYNFLGTLDGIGGSTRSIQWKDIIKERVHWGKKKVTHFRRKLSMYFLKAFTSLSTGNWALSGMTIATRHLPVLILRKRSTCAHRCQLKATKRWLRWGGGGWC